MFKQEIIPPQETKEAPRLEFSGLSGLEHDKYDYYLPVKSELPSFEKNEQGQDVKVGTEIRDSKIKLAIGQEKISWDNSKRNIEKVLIKENEKIEKKLDNKVLTNEFVLMVQALQEYHKRQENNFIYRGVPKTVKEFSDLFEKLPQDIKKEYISQFQKYNAERNKAKKNK